MPLGERTITAVGCGDVSLAVAAARGVDRRDAERALTVALELGLTVVDIHPGEDDAERLAGEVVRALRLRDTVVAAITPPVLPLVASRDTLMDRLPPGYVQARVETALRNTKLDAIPLVQLPLRAAWLSAKAWPELAGTAARLVREGKVLAWGARLDEADVRVPAPAPAPRDRDEPPPEPTLSDELRALTAEPWFVSLSVPYNLCARDAAALIAHATQPVPLGPEPPPPAPAPVSSVILSPFAITAPPPAARPARRTAPLAVFARQPLAGGALAGALGPGAKLTQRDDRNAIDAATLDRIALEVARLAPLVRTVPPAARSTDAARTLLERHKKREHTGAITLAELALRHVIDRGAIALPRLHRHMVVTDAVIAAASDPLSAQANAWIFDGKP